MMRPRLENQRGGEMRYKRSMNRLRALEAQLVRLEGAALVGIVLLMLALAGYNVVYRNILVPLQVHWAHSGPPVEPEAPTAPEPSGTPAAPEPAAAEPNAPAPTPAGDTPTEKSEFGGAFGGGGSDGGDEDGEDGEAPTPAALDDAEDDFAGAFGGGRDDDEADTPKPAPKPAAPAEAGQEEDEDEDFGGAFGGGRDDEETAAKPAPKPDPAEPKEDFGGAFGKDEDEDSKPVAKNEGGDFGGAFGGGDDSGGEEDEDGFGGAFGGAKPKPAAADADDSDPADEEEEADDFGDDDVFDNLQEIEAPGEEAEAGPKGGPPPEGSFAARMVTLIDDIKLDWIDVLLRQLVIVMSFLGGALATARRKHINVDAASKLLPEAAKRWSGVVTNGLAIAVCLTLANAGQRLVAISKEYPKDITPFADDWMFQLMFPLGFGLLALHFGVRLLESALNDVPAEVAPGGAANEDGESAEADADAAAGADEPADVDDQKPENEDEGDDR